jgi:spermidine synthase
VGRIPEKAQRGGGDMNIMERAVPTDGGVRYLIGEFVHEGFYHVYEGKLLHSEKGLQSLLVLEHPFWKRILFINGLVQFTLRDEFIYHEAIVHIPVQAMPEGRIKRVLICGGGDLGAAREVLKYPEVEEVIVADIDPKVTEIVRGFFPELMPPSSHISRLKLIHADAFRLAKEYVSKGETFDLVIVDSTDPDVSSERPVELSHSLFGREFHELLKILAPNGIIVQQAGTPFTMKNILETCLKTFREVYPPQEVFCYRANIPSFGGDSAFVIRSQADPKTPKRNSLPDLKYYNHDLHTTSFSLPEFWKEVVSLAVK